LPECPVVGRNVVDDYVAVGDNVAVTIDPAVRPEEATPPAATDPGQGVVEGIFTAPGEGHPMEARDHVRAMAGVGLDGDRYALRIGRYSADPRVDRDVTLIEAEEIETLAAEADVVLAPGESRRNVTTRGIRLNELVGRRFRIGDVVCEGTRLCEPCQYLTDLLGKPVLRPLVHRAGLRARILTDGTIALGDAVVAIP
jgi:MOSC domain-containing protein YiiM